MRISLFYILLIFTVKSLFCQPVCVINGSLTPNSTICTGQSSMLSETYGLNYECSGAWYLPSNLQNGLLSYYTFCGNCMDQTISNLHLTALGATLTTDRFGNSNSAYDFNGTSSNMQNGPGGPLGNSARTITLWFNDRGSLGTGADSIASNLYCYGNFTNNTFFQILHMSPSYGGVMKIDFIGSNITTTLAAGFKSWQFFAFVMDASSNYTTYINNSIAGTGTININTSSGPDSFGCSSLPSWEPKYWFNGKMDEIYFYSRDLSQTEILQFYNFNTIPTTYSWSTGATTSSISVTPSATAIYTLSATNGFYSCTASATVNVSPCTGVEELSNNSSIQLYPNPAADELNIQSSLDGINNSTIEIYNPLGRLVLTSKFEPKIKTQYLSEGLYLIKIYSDGNEIFRARFVKQ